MLGIIITISCFMIGCILICVKTTKNTELKLECMYIKFNFTSKNEKTLAATRAIKNNKN